MSNVTIPRIGVPIGTALVNGLPVDVTPHPEWVRFLSDLVSRAGGPTGASTNDLSVSQFEDAGIPENLQKLMQLADELGQVRAEAPAVFDVLEIVSGLRSEVEELRRQVQALQQGMYA